MSQLNSTEIQDSPVTDTNTKTQADICVDIEDLQASIIWIMVFPAVSTNKKLMTVGFHVC